MESKFQQLKQAVDAALAGAKDTQALEAVRVDFLGRKGKLAELMKEMAALPEDARRTVGAAANAAKQHMDAAFAAAQRALAEKERAHAEEREWVDVTKPGVWPAEGHLHPVSQAIAEITDVFAGIGFSRVRAPEVDWDYYAFEALNMPKDHPARDDWETYFIGENAAQKATGAKGKIVLTPHTSNVQVREMEKGQLPIRIINVGRTYRRQSDVSHAPMFHQFEGLMVDKDLTIGHLKGVLEYFAKTFFGPNRAIRLRPHHFRFTEPSFEIDISCDVCGGSGDCRLCKSGWLELGGAGMVHPNVLKAGGIDPETHTGFAFGWGVERTLMMRAGIKIDDIRTLYRSDLRFVNQF